jgi:hypothetical protein
LEDGMTGEREEHKDGQDASGGSLADAALLDDLRGMWERLDPVPVDLADRVCFALRLEDLEVELLRMEAELVGARGEERARTITFSSPSLSVMVTIGDEGADRVRLDGWIDRGAGLEIEAKLEQDSRRTVADGEGRFAVDGLPRGLVQLIFHPTDGAERSLRSPVVTPALQV